MANIKWKSIGRDVDKRRKETLQWTVKNKPGFAMVNTLIPTYVSGHNSEDAPGEKTQNKTKKTLF